MTGQGARQWGNPPGVSPSGKVVGSIPLGQTAWVTADDGDDTTAAFGDITKPYKTIQAAVDGLLAAPLASTGQLSGALMVMEGQYDEAVSIVGGAENIGIRIQGFGSVTGLRQLSLTASTLNFRQVNIWIDNMQLGSGTGSPVDGNVIAINGDAGFVSVRITDSFLAVNDAGVSFDVIGHDGAGAGFFLLDAQNATLGAFQGTSSSGVSTSIGSVALDRCTLRGRAAGALEITGAAAATCTNCVFVGRDAGIPAVSYGSSAALTIRDSALSVLPSAGTGDAIAGAGTGTVTLLGSSFDRGAGTGSIDVPTADVVTAGCALETGELIPVTGAASLVRYSLAVPSFTVAAAPTADPAAMVGYCSDETGGAVLCFSDGTDWRRCTDRAVIS
ncbi:MAG: hypothetical protein ACTSX8_00575 [Alphaproteobacteria bacterium]